MYAKLTNGNYSEYTLADLKRDNPTVSFPPMITPAVASQYNLHDVVEPVPPTPLFSQKVSKGPIEVVDGNPTQTYVVESLSTEELAAKRSALDVSMRQARLALFSEGLLDSVEAAIASLDEPDKTLVSIEWNHSAVVNRGSPWMSTMAAALGLTDDQLDTLFLAASQL